MSEQDHLDRAVSIKASLTDSGIEASIKSRFFAALDRLLGGMLDWPAAYFDGKAQFRRIENDIVSQARKREAEIQLTSLSESQRFEKTAELAAHLRNVKDQLNTRAIINDALQDLRTDPVAEDIEGDIEEDWFNVFGAFAKSASSERLQTIWGKVLSGEIKKPGSFSIKTLRLISELDQDTANLFQSMLARYDGNGFLVLDDNVKNQDLIDVVTLDELGYINQGAGLSRTIQFDDQGQGVHLLGKRLLVMKGKPNESFSFSVAKLTRCGEQVKSLVALDPNENIAAAKIVEIGSDKVTSATIYDVIRVMDNRVEHQPIGKILKNDLNLPATQTSS